jgi:hypothetical protein
MDWIEHIFHVSPDAGNGSLELFFVLCPIAALLTQVSLLDAKMRYFSGRIARRGA